MKGLNIEKYIVGWDGHLEQLSLAKHYGRPPLFLEYVGEYLVYSFSEEADSTFVYSKTDCFEIIEKRLSEFWDDSKDLLLFYNWVYPHIETPSQKQIDMYCEYLGKKSGVAIRGEKQKNTVAYFLVLEGENER